MSEYKVVAFVSYSRKDSRAAKWLQRKLEGFRFPVKQVAEKNRPPHSKFIRPVYRDKTDLEFTSGHYWADIKKAIGQSRYLLVLCSPNSAKPKDDGTHPVDEEVRHFLSGADIDDSLARVVPVILDGDLESTGETACLCPALQDHKDRIPTRNLPTMLPDGDQRLSEARENGLVGVVAYMLGVERGTIRDIRARERRRRFWRGITGSSIISIVLAILTIIAVQQWLRADVLLTDASRSYHKGAIQAIARDRPGEAYSLFAQALRMMPTNRAAAMAAIHHLIEDGTTVLYMFAQPYPITSIAFDPSSHMVIVGSGLANTYAMGGQLSAFRFRTGEQVWSVDYRYPITGVDCSPDGAIVAATFGARVRLSGMWGGLVAFDADTRKECWPATTKGLPCRSPTFSPDGGTIAYAWDDFGFGVSTRHAETGEYEYVDVASWERRPLAAESRLGFPTQDKDIIIDEATGQARLVRNDNDILWTVDIPATVTSRAFSADSQFVAIGARDGFVRIYAASLVRSPNVTDGEENSIPEGLRREPVQQGVSKVPSATTSGPRQLVSPGARYLARYNIQETSPLVGVVDRRTGRVLWSGRFTEDPIRKAQFSANGEVVSFQNFKEGFHVVASATGRPAFSENERSRLEDVAFSSTESLMAYAMSESVVHVSDTTTRELIWSHQVHPLLREPSLVFHDDLIAAFGYVFEASTGSEICRRPRVPGAAFCSFLPDGSRRILWDRQDNIVGTCEIPSFRREAPTWFFQGLLPLSSGHADAMGSEQHASREQAVSARMRTVLDQLAIVRGLPTEERNEIEKTLDWLYTDPDERTAVVLGTHAITVD